MNRADLSLVLNQIDGVGDTLLRNRMNAEAKQERAADRNLRERMFTEQQATRKELQTQNNAWKTQNEDQQQLQMIIKANADGSLDDASRERANQWIMQHPQLSATGIQLTKPMPKAVGTMETSQTRNHAELKKLQEQIRMATTPEAKAQAEQDLADFKSLLPGREKSEETKPDAGAMTALNELQRAWAEAIKNKDQAEADRIGASIDATRQKWNINPAGGAAATPAPTASQPKPQPAATNAPVQLPKVQTQADVDRAIQEANDAINGTGKYAGKRKDPKVVKQMLREMGIELKQ